MFHKIKESKVSEWMYYVWITLFLNSMTILYAKWRNPIYFTIKIHKQKEFYDTVRKK